MLNHLTRSRFGSIITLLVIIYFLLNLLMFNFVSLNKKKVLNVYKPILKLTNELLNTNCHSAFDFKLTNLSLSANSNKNNHLECKQVDWISIISDGTLLYNKEYLNIKNLEIDYCEYQTVKWKTNDFEYDLAPAVRILNGSKLDLNEQFFHITCKDKISKQTYKSSFARIFKSSDKIKPNTTKQPINIMIVGLDSVSRETWLKSLPKSSHFLFKILDAEVMKQFNIGKLKIILNGFIFIYIFNWFIHIISYFRPQIFIIKILI